MRKRRRGLTRMSLRSSGLRLLRFHKRKSYGGARYAPMTTFLDRYFSFHGRLARLPFFIRDIYLGIAGFVLFVASIPLFSNGGRVWWWVGFVEVIASIALFGVGAVSLIVRRLHDL